MDEPQDRPLWQGLDWMFAIWLASTTVLGLVPSRIRFWLKA